MKPKQRQDASGTGEDIVRWFQIGNGSRIHAVSSGCVYTFCGIGGAFSGPWNALVHKHRLCKACVDRLTPNKGSSVPPAAAERE